MGYVDELKIKSRALKKDIMAIYIACRRPDIPWYVKLLAAIIIGYALSPIDFIPDFIPVLGYLDDLFLLPLGIGFMIRLIPDDIIEACRREAEVKYEGRRPANWISGLSILIIWVLIIWFAVSKISGIRKG